ncbi:MAG: DUF2249 domain-containing protein [Chloroflexota bacterium]|nr:DUF2249 domain-containing protein [Chloroflexota bacterium]MDE3193091.1 DUF2249 domain-containing protein [Chloroflexota bacterium]
MSTVTAAIHEHHKEIQDRIADTTTRATESGSADDLDAMLRVLREDLLPHARGEEKRLYPAVDPLVATHGRATATMSIDHEHIEAYVKAIGVVVERMRAATGPARAQLAGDLHDLIQRLRAILDLHTEKEERVYFPLIDKAMTPEEQAKLLEGIHEAAEGTKDPTLDVRTLAPARRHGVIFETFGALGEGEAFVLLNDHDPKPLYYQFSAEMPGTFTWDYLERGPDWRVRIGRVAKAAA